MPIVPFEPLTPETYAPYGRVLGPEGEDFREVNEGTARRFDRVGDVVNLRPAATLNVAAFRCQPRAAGPFRLRSLEKHPFSEQLFVPMNSSRYVVVVAQHGGDAPDPKAVRAFLAHGRQSVSYAPDVWHHTLIALDRETDFMCFVWEDNSRGDCVVHALLGELELDLPLPPVF